MAMDVELDYTIVKRLRGPSGTINLRKQEPELRVSPSSALMSIRASSRRPHPGSSFTVNDFRPDDVSECLLSSSSSSRRLKGARLSGAQHGVEGGTVAAKTSRMWNTVLDICHPWKSASQTRPTCGRGRAVELWSRVPPLRPPATRWNLHFCFVLKVFHFLSLSLSHL